MATYANKTCTNCGIRKPQPEMYQKEVYVETGKSKTGISGATLFGTFAGDKKSGSQVRNWLFNNGQRTYKRKKVVWLCGSCSGRAPLANSSSMSSVKKWFFVAIAFLILIGVFSEPKKPSTSGTQSTTIQTSP
jgi:hypothetical protein